MIGVPWYYVCHTMGNIRDPALFPGRLEQKTLPCIWPSIYGVKTNAWRDERRHKNEASGTKLWSCQGCKSSSYLLHIPKGCSRSYEDHTVTPTVTRTIHIVKIKVHPNKSDIASERFYPKFDFHRIKLDCRKITVRIFFFFNFGINVCLITLFMLTQCDFNSLN